MAYRRAPRTSTIPSNSSSDHVLFLLSNENMEGWCSYGPVKHNGREKFQCFSSRIRIISKALKE